MEGTAKMNAQELIELVRAGFTKEEIQALTQTEEQTKPEASLPQADHATQVTLDDIEDKTPQAVQEKDDTPGWVVSLQKAMTDMVKTMQSYNRAMSGKGAVETVQTTEDILREMFSEPK